jgi:hypothetical protein
MKAPPQIHGSGRKHMALPGSTRKSIFLQNLYFDIFSVEIQKMFGFWREILAYCLATVC